MRFLFVDRITEMELSRSISGIKHITFDDHCLYQDDDARYCFYPALIGETLGQLAAWNAMKSLDFKHRPVAGVVSSVDVFRKAYVGETLHLYAEIESLSDEAVQYHAEAKINDITVLRVNGALGPMLPMETFIDSETVQQQFNEIFRPLAEEESLIFTPIESEEIFPLHQPFLPFMDFDGVVTFEPTKTMTAFKRITRAAFYFSDHFPKKPVFPMTVLLSCQQSMASTFLKKSFPEQSYQLVRLQRIKMNQFVQPGDEIVCTLEVKSSVDNMLTLSFLSKVQGKRVCLSEMIFQQIH